MDITIDVGYYKLNVRGSVLIEHNGKILAHRNINSNHYALVGGRVEIGEDSETTVKRDNGRTRQKDRSNWICCNNRKLF